MQAPGRNEKWMPTRRSALIAGLGATAVFATGGGAWASSVGARRIVAAGGAITETVYALGEDSRIVGVDTTSLHPADALRDKANVGYVRALSIEGLLSLAPDLVLTVESAGPPAVLANLRGAGVRVVTFGDDFTEAGVVSRIRGIGREVGAERRAEALAVDIEAQFARLAQARARLNTRKHVLFLLSLQNGRPLVGGRGTSADAIIRLAGGVNAVETLDGFKPMTDEGVIGTAADVVLVMDRGGHALTAERVFGLQTFARTPAAANSALIAMDGLLLLGFGPRTARAAGDLMARLYPDLAADVGSRP
jgi:iron complex transport system substrate-binding protein